MEIQPKYQIWVKIPVFTIKNINSFYVVQGYVAAGFVKNY